MIIDMIESVILLFVFCLSHVFLVSIFFFSFFKNFIYVPFLFLSYNSVFFFTLMVTLAFISQLSKNIILFHV